MPVSTPLCKSLSKSLRRKLIYRNRNDDLSISPDPGFVWLYDHNNKQVYDHNDHPVQVPEEFANA
jgi:hypothetical protein